jgi:hypothetical protein
VTVRDQPDVITLDPIRVVIRPREVIEAVRKSFIAHARGQVQARMPGLLTFEDPPGDCQIKFGHVRGEPSYLATIASSGYRNERLGIPVNDGMIVVLSAETSRVKTILLAHGRGRNSGRATVESTGTRNNRRLQSRLTSASTAGMVDGDRELPLCGGVGPPPGEGGRTLPGSRNDGVRRSTCLKAGRSRTAVTVDCDDNRGEISELPRGPSGG